MAKFNRGPIRSAGSGPMRAVDRANPTTLTSEGAPAYLMDDKSELFRLAVANTVGENTFYESADARDKRYQSLVRKVAVQDPIWTYNLLTWLRSHGNMRSASLVGAVEMTRAWLAANKCPGAPHQGHASSDSVCPNTRSAPVIPVDPSAGSDTRGLLRAVIDEVCQRADEPGEMIAYYLSNYGRQLPKPIRRGLADAVRRLYTQYAMLKYDTATRGGGESTVRFADVIDLVHPKPTDARQDRLFQLCLERRHGREINHHELAGTLDRVWANVQLREQVARGEGIEALYDPQALRAAGFTWENALSLGGSRIDKRKLWERLLDANAVGYMALLRNLRNLEQAGISEAHKDRVRAILTDPQQVASSRQFPYRFLSAHLANDSYTWSGALETALDLSVSNVPELEGTTLVLIDTSASMTATMSERSSMSFAQQAALFGCALAVRNTGRVSLHGFASGVFSHPVRSGASTLHTVNRFVQRIGEVGHGTQVAASIQATYNGHDRVVVISDEQTAWAGGWRGSSVDASVPANVPLYVFNIGGYRAAMAPHGNPNRHQLAGLTDATFKTIPLIEAGNRASWPWDVR